MDNGEIPPLPVCHQVCTQNRPRSHWKTILAKSLNAATSQLQRILIKTFAYDFTVKYLPGVNNQLADCLSRLGCLQDKIKLPRLKVHLLTTRLSATSDKLQQIRQATQDDDTMTLLKHTITFGWPHTVQELLKELQAYWTFREGNDCSGWINPESHQNCDSSKYERVNTAPVA